MRRPTAHHAHRHSHAPSDGTRPGHDHSGTGNRRETLGKEGRGENSGFHFHFLLGTLRSSQKRTKKAPLDWFVRGICIGYLALGEFPVLCWSRHFSPLFGISVFSLKPGGGKRPSNPSAILRGDPEMSYEGMNRRNRPRRQSLSAALPPAGDATDGLSRSRGPWSDTILRAPRPGCAYCQMAIQPIQE